MSPVSGRLRRRIDRDFAEPGAAASALALVGSCGDSERVQAAVVLCGRGDWNSLQQAANLAQLDWRDVLMSAGLADSNWPTLLDAELRLA